MIPKKKINLSGESIFKDLAKELIPHREKPIGSMLFIVEGTQLEPRVGIRYPGRKLRRRTEIKRANKSTVLWANLLDFEVIPFENGQPGTSIQFTYTNLLKDFEDYKKKDNEFWDMILELHRRNQITKIPPNLGGIEPKLFLEMLKWMWIQEDVNYKLSHSDVGSPLKYRLETRSQKPTGKGAGRDKFFAALILVKEGHFSAGEIKKIIP
ncbi:MAG: hypothetical protein Q8O71_02955 [bacterium]|nr:hypothetical protein [bacterium]